MRLKQRDKDTQKFRRVDNSIVDNLNKNLKLLLHGVFYVNAHLLVGHNGTPLLPPHKLHLNIKYTTLSLTMIIKQPLSHGKSTSEKNHTPKCNFSLPTASNAHKLKSSQWTISSAWKV